MINRNPNLNLTPDEKADLARHAVAARLIQDDPTILRFESDAGHRIEIAGVCFADAARRIADGDGAISKYIAGRFGADPFSRLSGANTVLQEIGFSAP